MADGICLSVQLQCMLTQIGEAQPQVAVVGHHLAVRLLMPSVHAQQMGAPCGLPQVHNLLQNKWDGNPGFTHPLECKEGCLAWPIAARGKVKPICISYPSCYPAVAMSAGLFAGMGNTEVSFGGKIITVSSIYGSSYTVINGKNANRGFIFDTNEVGAILNGAPRD